MQSFDLEAKLEERYGKDSSVANFLRDFVLERGKVIVERTSIEVILEDGEKRPGGLHVSKQRDIVLKADSFPFGLEVMVSEEAPTIHVGQHNPDGRVRAFFLIVDRRYIYATRIVK